MSSERDAEADRAAVLEANDRFYVAFEARDLDAMSDLWVHDDDTVCVHPGWSPLHGWSSIGAGWTALFDGPQRLQFIVTDAHVSIVGDMAWVSCDENLLTAGASGVVAALNVFRRIDDAWRMVVHHGAPVMARGDDEVDD